jgi:hypothetical protein
MEEVLLLGLKDKQVSMVEKTVIEGHMLADWGNLNC